MENIDEFKEKALSDGYTTYRANFLMNYAWIEKYCKENYGKGNYIDWLADKVNLLEGNEQAIKELIGIDYIKSNSLYFQINPTVKNATDLLRKKLIDPSTKSEYNKSESHAAFELLKQIRDNLTHDGKFEMEPNQYERNFLIIKAGSSLTDSLIKKLT